MNNTTLVPILQSGQLRSVKICEPDTRGFNEHTRKRIWREVRLIKQVLQLHGYQFRKLSGRECYRIGPADNCWLLVPQFEPFRWELLPHQDNLAYLIQGALKR